MFVVFFFQAEDGIRDLTVTGVQTCALPISALGVPALWVGYGYAEGWAHYCEQMMWEEDLGNGNAEQHIGQLADALLRNVRFLASIGMHTQSLTLDARDSTLRSEEHTSELQSQSKLVSRLLLEKNKNTSLSTPC